MKGFRLVAAVLLSCCLSSCVDYDLAGSIEKFTFGTTCADNLDNDHDGWFDGEDPDCPMELLSAETGYGAGACNDGVDNDGDSLVDASDDGCEYAADDSEFQVAVDVRITEFMANPAAVSDTNGEWFEVANSSDGEVNLDGWSISDAGSVHEIHGDLVIPPGGYVVFSRGAADVNGLPVTISPLYVYGATIYLSNSEDELTLKDSLGNVVDHIHFFASNIASGKSTVINGDRWCLSSARIEGDAGDYGSPGKANDACP
jgi:hypothetical protein